MVSGPENLTDHVLRADVPINRLELTKTVDSEVCGEFLKSGEHPIHRPRFAAASLRSLIPRGGRVAAWA
jgi:hypothetical protein